MKPYLIDPSLNIPIYQQLVDAVRTDIKKGTLPDGTRLPTVQALALDLGIAKGTIKRAYDELAALGLVNMVQGSGTFVRYQPADSHSTSEQASAAVDQLLDQLEELGVSLSEIQSLIHVKLQQRAQSPSLVKVAVVECNPEGLSQLVHQLQQVEQIELRAYLLDELQAYPYRLDEDLDLVVTTVSHADYLKSILLEQKKIARIALRLSPKSVSQIVTLHEEDSLGILSCSQRFGNLIYETCQIYAEYVNLYRPVVLDQKLDMDSFLQGKTAVIIPPELENQLSHDQARQLYRFARSHKLIRCTYEMDEGSFLYLHEKITRLLERKSI